MRHPYYILVERQPVEATMLEWGAFFEVMANRRVASTDVGKVRVSTVFLGIDHRLYGDGPPILFETMAFDPDGEPNDVVGTRRCATWEEAEEQHRQAVADIEQGDGS